MGADCGVVPVPVEIEMDPVPCVLIVRLAPSLTLLAKLMPIVPVPSVLALRVRMTKLVFRGMVSKPLLKELN